MDAYITVDIGGTNIRCAVFDEKGDSPMRYKKTTTLQNNQSAEKNIIQVIKESWPDGFNVKGISAAAPGSVDVKNGIVILAPNISGWKNIKLKKILEEEFHILSIINNDARLAAFGEWKKGAGQGHENLLYFTISTGLGGGAIVKNELIEGDLGIATEVGHITVDVNGPKCGCGKFGHLEAFSSGTGIENYVKQQLNKGFISDLLKENSTAKEIFSAASAGDCLAIKAFEQAGYYLGIGIANYLHIFNPSCIIFGGGVSQSGELIFKPFRKSLEQHVLSPDYLKNLEIKTAWLGDNAGLIGALEYLKLYV